MDTAAKRARALRSVDHMRVIEARMVLLTPPLNLPHCNTVYYSVRGFAQLAQML